MDSSNSLVFCSKSSFAAFAFCFIVLCCLICILALHSVLFAFHPIYVLLGLQVVGKYTFTCTLLSLHFVAFH